MGAVDSIATVTDPTINSQLYNQSNNLAYYRNSKGQQFQKYQVHNYAYPNFVAKYQSRIRHPHPNVVNAFYIKQIQNAFNCSSSELFQIVIQSIAYRLADFIKLDAANAIYFMQGILMGYEQLFPAVGFIQVKDTMIGVNKDNAVKVWFNSKFQLNSLENKSTVAEILSQQQQQIFFVSSLLNLMDSKAKKQPIWIQYVTKWKQQNLKTFQQCIQYTSSFIKTHKITKCKLFVTDVDSQPFSPYFPSSQQIQQNFRLLNSKYKQQSYLSRSQNKNLLLQRSPVIKFDKNSLNKSIQKKQQLRNALQNGGQTGGYANIRAKAITQRMAGNGMILYTNSSSNSSSQIKIMAHNSTSTNLISNSQPKNNIINSNTLSRSFNTNSHNSFYIGNPKRHPIPYEQNHQLANSFNQFPNNVLLNKIPIQKSSSSHQIVLKTQKNVTKNNQIVLPKKLNNFPQPKQAVSLMKKNININNNPINNNCTANFNNNCTANLNNNCTVNLNNTCTSNKNNTQNQIIDNSTNNSRNTTTKNNSNNRIGMHIKQLITLKNNKIQISRYNEAQSQITDKNITQQPNTMNTINSNNTMFLIQNNTNRKQSTYTNINNQVCIIGNNQHINTNIQDKQITNPCSNQLNIKKQINIQQIYKNLPINIKQGNKQQQYRKFQNTFSLSQPNLLNQNNTNQISNIVVNSANINNTNNDRNQQSYDKYFHNITINNNIQNRHLNLQSKLKLYQTQRRQRLLQLQRSLQKSIKLGQSIDKSRNNSTFSRMSKSTSNFTKSVSYGELNNLLKSIHRKKQ